jgi:copper transport protein
VRRLAVVWAGVALALGGLLVMAPAASAHAELQSTDPASGTSVAAPPSRVLLKFSESVDIDAGSIRVFDSEGKRVDEGKAPTHPPGEHSSVVLPLPALHDGTYVVTWRVVSADSHPVHGAFTFRVGPGQAAPDAAAADLVKSSGGSRAVGGLFALVRFLVFASLLVLVGGAAFLAGLWPAGWRDRKAVRLLWGALVVALVATFIGLLLQGPYGAGLPLGNALKLSVVRPVLRTRFGRVWLGRLVLLAAFALLLDLFRRRRAAAPVLVGLGTAVALALLATPGLSAHAATGDLVPIALPVDDVHLAAAALWLGGLAMLLVGVLPYPVATEAEAAEQSRIVTRFSRLALWCVVALIATGSFQSWRQVRTLDAFTDTTYGRTLLVKLGLFAGLVALAAGSRALVRRGPLSTLRKTVLAEAAAAAAVLAVTALLVNAVPARIALARPVSKELTAGKVIVDITIDPAKAGPAAIHLYTLSPNGQELEVQDAAVTLTLPSRGIGPIEVPVRRAGPGHFAAYGFTIPLPGSWRLEVAVRTSDIDEFRAATTVRIR